MIRFIFYTLVLLVGLSAAALWFGEMRHLRMVFGRDLPDWSRHIDDNAGLFRGSETRENSVSRWRALAPSAQGLRWVVTTDGDFMQAEMQLLLRYNLGAIDITGGRGVISYEQIAPRADGTLIPFQNITGLIPLRAQGAQTGYVEYVIRQGTEIGPIARQQMELNGKLDGNRWRVSQSLR